MGDTEKRTGFTLIEMMVVIAVVALLATLSVSVFHRVQARSHAILCTGRLRDLGVAVNLYLTDHGGAFPDLEAARSSRSEDVPVIDNTLDEYVDSADVFRCPADDEGLFEQTGTSYFWNSVLSGQRAANLTFFGARASQIGTPVITDKQAFHESVGDGVIVLYADGHVTSKVEFKVGSR